MGLPYGVVVVRDGERVEVKNTEALRSEVLGYRPDCCENML